MTPHATCRLARAWQLGIDMTIECDLPEASGMSSSMIGRTFLMPILDM